MQATQARLAVREQTPRGCFYFIWVGEVSFPRPFPRSFKSVVGLSWIYRTKLGLVYVRYLRKVKRGSILGELDL